MTPKQNERYLKRKRLEAGAQFMKDSVGARWLLRELIANRINGMKIMEKLRRVRGA